jgi:hypothetical protein
LKANIVINNERFSAPNFYKEMRKLMAETIKNVITQLKNNNNIDEMLLVFEIALNKNFEFNYTRELLRNVQKIK